MVAFLGLGISAAAKHKRSEYDTFSFLDSNRHLMRSSPQLHPTTQQTHIYLLTAASYASPALVWAARADNLVVSLYAPRATDSRYVLWYARDTMHLRVIVRGRFDADFAEVFDVVFDEGFNEGDEDDLGDADVRRSPTTKHCGRSLSCVLGNHVVIVLGFVDKGDDAKALILSRSSKLSLR